MEGNEQAISSSAEPKPKPTRKPKPKPTSEPKGKRSLNLSLPVEDYERLAIHAIRGNTTISELVSQLARTHLREYHLTRTATRAGDTDAA